MMLRCNDCGKPVTMRAGKMEPHLHGATGQRCSASSLMGVPQDYVKFGDVARRQCGEQAQYVSRCIDGVHGSPNLGEGLRFDGDPRDYHEVLIHKDDIDEFVRRYKAWREARRG